MGTMTAARRVERRGVTVHHGCNLVKIVAAASTPLALGSGSIVVIDGANNVKGWAVILIAGRCIALRSRDCTTRRRWYENGAPAEICNRVEQAESLRGYGTDGDLANCVADDRPDFAFIAR
jgi:hypothetical protein